MKEIILACGLKTMVDDCDFEWLSQWKWHALRCKGGEVYASRNTIPQPGRILMHREILSAPKGVLVDHRDRHTLNNQRINLRLCTRGQNRSNSIPSAASGLKGVSWIERDNIWVAQICIQGARKVLGYFNNPTDAARAYDKAAMEIHGEFALTNHQLNLV